MSSNFKSLTIAVPTLNGSNYLTWAPKMTNFLQASRLNWVLRKTHPEETEEGTKQSKIDKYQGYGTTKEVWDGL
ncbi:hypothetical protein PAXRUDRAFT_16102 [Paxillus rubicundulus Ve08.2h10]|uniref:DUF4219 domain-containing protein n=1 Tax=Paxillus rubicundulus Ve08.2h10 TaxID=930991 RepID=A0A0D0DFI2_9AGAM|nr:hypothetical protein PAXRUDRAFT_16102 [Paxillus rubicundulus Ve08.2h10]